MDLKVENVIDELRKIAWFDIRKIFDKDGQLKSPAALDDDTAAAIESIKISAGGNELKVSSKLRALELLGRNLSMWAKERETTPRVQIVLEGRDLLT